MSPAGSSPRRPRPACALDKLPLKTMQAVEPRITKAVFGVLSVGNSVKSRSAYGGTAPNNVRGAGQTLAQAAEKQGVKRWQEVAGNALPDTMSPPRCGVLCCGRKGLCGSVFWLPFVSGSVLHLPWPVSPHWRCPRAGAPVRSNCRRGAATPAPSAQLSPDGTPVPGSPQDTAMRTGFDAQGKPVATIGQKRPFILDPLLQ